MEYNTRRFVIDDKRELQYRVEVQNRVYKKEIAALDAEIRRLERLLDSPTTNTPPTASSTSSSASIIAAIQKVSSTFAQNSLPLSLLFTLLLLLTTFVF